MPENSENQEEERIYKLFALVIGAVAFAMGLFFLPLTADFYDFNKQTLIFSATAVLLAGWLIFFIRHRHVRIRTAIFDLPVLLLMLSAAVSLIISSPNKVESLAFPGGAGTIILLGIWYFLTVNLISLNNISIVLYGLSAGAGLLGLLAVLQFFGVGANLIFPGTAWLSQKTWTPAGSLFTLALFTGALLPVPLFQLKKYLVLANLTNLANLSQRRRLGSLVFYALVSLFAISGLTVAVYTLSTSLKPLLLPANAGWVVAVDVLKNVRSAFFGVGFLNYLSAFTQSKPLYFNNLPIWNLRFAVSGNWYLTLLTEAGLFALVSYLFLVFRFGRKILPIAGNPNQVTPAHREELLGLSAVIALVFALQLLLPGSLLLHFLLFTALALLAVLLPHRQYLEKSIILPYTMAAIAAVLIAGAVYGYSNVYAGEYYLKQAADAFNANRGVDTYNLQLKMLEKNPHLDRYHVIYSQTNLALATSLSQKKDLNDQDRSNITQLVVQAIREAKSAVSLNPGKVTNWENMAGIYRAVISFAQGADNWTLASYQQAIALDPLNPALRLDLGGLYYGAGNYDLAIQSFAQSANLKPDWPNAHYNLASALREKKDWENAARQMEIVLALLPNDSPDRKKAEEELAQIKNNLPAATASASKSATEAGELTRPGSRPSPAISPKLVLPTGVEPQVTPLPSPTPTP